MTTAGAGAPLQIDAASLRGRALIPVLVFVGLLVAVISSLGAPLVPTIATDYRVSLGTAQWSLTVTLLVGAIMSPVIGRLGDGPLRRLVLLAALGVLVVGSATAALPTSVFALLIAGRAMQGVGLALLPLAMSVARDHLDPDRARSTLATLSVTAVVGVGLGYPLTGLAAEHLDFHAGFWIAAGLGALAMILVALVVPSSVHRPSNHVDRTGSIVLAVALTGLLVATSEADEWGWQSATLWGVLAASLAALAGWSRYQLRATEPLVDLRLLRHRTVLTANVVGIIAGIGTYMLMSMIIRYVQTPTSVSYGLGASVVVAGLVLLPMSVLSFLCSRLVTFLGKWVRPDRILPMGLLLFGLAMVITAIARGSLWEIFVIMGVAGLGMGSSFAVLPRMIVSAVPAQETSSALALNQVLRTIGTAIGSALAATILTAHTATSSEFPSNEGYTVGCLVALALCLTAATLSWVLPPRRSARKPLTADQELEVEEDVNAAISGTITLDEGLNRVTG